MSLATETAKSTRVLTYFVRIYTTPGTYSGANVLLIATDPTSATGVPGVDGIRISKSFDSPVPVCQLDLSRVPTWITRGQGVTVDVGYNGLTQRLFTGFIQSRERRVGKGSVQCMGRLWTAFRTVQITERDVNGDTVETAIGDILDYVGITDNRSLTIPAFTLGTASDAKLERMPASQMLQTLMDIDGCRIYELGTGQIVIRVIDEAPAPTAFKTYTTNANATARVLEASDREDPEYYRNKVIVTGATVTEGSAPDETSRTITATATNTGSALVQPALPEDTFLEAEYNNHLIDTDAKAADVAIRLLAKFARIPRQLQIEIAGDPELELGQTLAFVMPELDLNDRGFVSGIEHVIDANGYVTRLTDFRGAGDTGGTLAQNPIAAFTFKSEVEVFGATTNVFAALDASNSFDPDGTIASYVWSDNQTTSPEIATLTTAQVLVRADTSAWTGSWDVTLTVTDNDGLTGTTTITIPYENTEAEIVIPAVYAAINNRHSASLDGALTWNDQTVGSGNSISCGARAADGVNFGHAIFGTSTGRIYRTTDGCATAPTLVYTSAAAVAMNDLQWDWRNGNVCWAVDENAIVYISLNAGVTWVIYDSLRTKLSVAGALGNKLGLPFAGGVYVGGGTGAGSPLIAYDPVVGSHNWVNQTFTGDLLTDTVTTPGDATLRIIDFTAGWTGTAIILAWASGGGASITAVYFTTSAPGPTAAYTRASTTFGGLKSGRCIVSDNVAIKSDYYICAFANRSVWYSTNGIAWTEVTNVMPVGVTPNHCIGMTGSTELTGLVGMFGVFMIAASDGIYKYTPRIDATASYVRGGTGAGTALPASAVPMKLSIGAPFATTPSGGALAAIGNDVSPRDVSLLAGTTWSTPVQLSASITDSDVNIFAITETNFFAVEREYDATTPDQSGFGVGSYSKDAGATWAATPGAASIGAGGDGGFVRDAGGRIWRFYQNAASDVASYVEWSEDEGDTWTASHTITGAGEDLRAWKILAHPTNQNIIAVMVKVGGITTGHAIVSTQNRGSSWTRNDAAVSPYVSAESWHAVMLATGRIVFSTFTSTTLLIRRTDNYGVSLTTAQTFTAATADHKCHGLWASGTNVAAVIEDDGDQSGTPAVRIYFSNDSGTTWAALTLGEELYAFLGSALPTGPGFAATPDGICLQTGRTKRVVSLTPISSSGVWTDVTFNYPHAADGDMNMCAIPIPLGH